MAQPSKPTDGELLTAFLADNGQAAFAELVDRYGSMVHGVCLRVLTDHHEAQDVAQAVFLALARKASAMRGAESVGGWLHKVAWRLAINTQQSRIRRQRREENAMRDQPTMSEDQPDAGLFRAELDAAVNQLPDRYRQPLVLFHLLGCSLDETSRQLSLNPSTTGNRLARAREMLRKKLIRRGVTAGTVGALTTLLSAEAGAAVLPATFVSATVQAASLAATGNLAAGVGTGVVSAKVAAMTKGAIQMMFIAQLKTAALITAACVVVAGSGAVVAKEVLTTPATPVSAQAEQKISKPAMATNDTVTIAWGEAVKGLQACLEVKQTTIKPGDDITLTMSLRNVRPAGGDPITVWDNKYSNGYRADFYRVVTPDGQSRVLRRPEQLDWRKNIPTPISIQSGKSWTLAGFANDVNVKSLKSLGLDTTQSGIYTITGYYEAEGGQRAFGETETNYLFWGGKIATPPVEVKVGDGGGTGNTGKANGAPDEAAARRLMLKWIKDNNREADWGVPPITVEEIQVRPDPNLPNLWQAYVVFKKGGSFAISIEKTTGRILLPRD
jgi:RNA polymerase sigma factor (sigma-70 family)